MELRYDEAERGITVDQLGSTEIPPLTA